MKSKLVAEGKAFDSIIENRVKNKISFDLKVNKINKYFFNNPWRYDDTRKIALKEKIKFVIKSLKNKKKVLDVGCGAGTLLFELARAGYQSTGIDLSKKSLEIAENTAKRNLSKAQYKKIKLIRASFDKFSKNNEKYDAIIFFKTLHHLENIKKVVDLSYQLLNKKGLIIIVEPLRDNLENINIAFAYIIRSLAVTWENRSKKILENQKNLENNFDKLIKEYKYISSKKGYDQSPMDNTINSSQEVLKAISKKFFVEKKFFRDAFQDKIIGGIRGKNRSNEVKLINKFDNFLINKKILKGTTLMLVAKKK